jgi:subtilisin family serine protease
MPASSRRKKILTVMLAFIVSVVSAFPAAATDRIPNDTYFKDQWDLMKIGAPQAWNSSIGFEGITIAIIDSGVDIDHPDLKDNIWTNTKEVPGVPHVGSDGSVYVDDLHGWNFVGNNNDPRPDLSSGYNLLGANHGTIDAGIADARGGNGQGIAGVAWQATIMPLRVLNSNGVGNPKDVVKAVNYAVDNGAKIINLSFAGPTYSPELAAALHRAYDAGVFIVAAAGNAPDGGDAVDLDKSPEYPICMDSDSSENFIYGVAATDDSDKKAVFSNYGAGCVDISAPGTHMISTQFVVPGNKDFTDPYGGYYDGTSLAAAEVSGLVADIWSLDYSLTPKQIMNILTESAVNIDAQNPGYFGKIGRGRIDAAAAIQATLALLKPQAEPVSTASLLPSGEADRLVVTAPGPGRPSDIRIFTEDGTFVRSFQAFPQGFNGGASLAMADFDGISRKTIVVGALAGGTPQVRIFDINTRLIGSFLAYDSGFTGGVSVAAGDLDGDGKDEIVTGAGPGGGPQVRIFSPDGRPIGSFFAFDRMSRAGINVAVGDLEGDGKDEIVTVAPGGEVVRVWDGKGNLLLSFPLPFAALSLSVEGAAAGKAGRIIVQSKEKTGIVAHAYDANGDLVGDVNASTLLPLGATSGVPSWRDIALGAVGHSPAAVTVAASNGDVVRFYAYEPKFFGGVSAAIAE